MTFTSLPAATIRATMLVSNTEGTPSSYSLGVSTVLREANRLFAQLEAADSSCLVRQSLTRTFIEWQPTSLRSFYDNVRDYNSILKDARGPAPLRCLLEHLIELATLRINLRRADLSLAPPGGYDPRYSAWLTQETLLDVL